MEFFEDGTENGGIRYNKAQAFILLQELYEKISKGDQRKKELLAELKSVEAELENSRAQLREMEAYS